MNSTNSISFQIKYSDNFVNNFFAYRNRSKLTSFFFIRTQFLINASSLKKKKEKRQPITKPFSKLLISVKIPPSFPVQKLQLVTKEGIPFVFEFFTFCTEIRKRNRHPFPSASTSRYVTTRLPPQICVTFYSSFSCEQVSHIPSCPLN